MRVIEIAEYGGPEVLRLADRDVPRPGPDEALVRVFAAGVNRPDVQQRRGLYPPPPGASDIPGLEIAGVVEAVGSSVQWPQPGDAVCALVTGGGYAEYCIVPTVQCMPIPRGLNFLQAAVLPEVFFTAWNSLVLVGRLAEGETLLFQGGTSGVGMAAIQIAKLLRRAQVFVTAGSDEKLKICREMGADAAVSYHGEWDKEVGALNDQRGIDLIIDAQAGPYTNRELDLLADDGRLVLLASHLGTTAEVNLRQIVRRRLTLAGSVIRSRPPEFKGRIARALVQEVWPLIEAQRIKMPICATFPLERAAEAHTILDENRQVGKVALTLDAKRALEIPSTESHGAAQSG